MIRGPKAPGQTRAFLAAALKAQEQWPQPPVELAIELKPECRRFLLSGGFGRNLLNVTSKAITRTEYTEVTRLRVITNRTR